VAPAYVPEIKTLVFDDTLWVLTVKVALVLPAATVTLDGTVATDVFPPTINYSCILAGLALAGRSTPIASSGPPH
jgi:hypothetical protein